MYTNQATQTVVGILRNEYNTILNHTLQLHRMSSLVQNAVTYRHDLRPDEIAERPDEITITLPQKCALVYCKQGKK